MSPEAALIELFDRVSARNGAAVFMSADELGQWPATAVTAMKSQKLLAKTRPATSVVCPGCERACVMPTNTLTRSGHPTASFVVCDKRNDINRVPISTDLLNQWRCTAEAVCSFVTKSLGIRRTEQRSAIARVWNIGMAQGKKRSQMLCLRAEDELTLLVGNSRIPLAELVGFQDAHYLVDPEMVRELVDSATTADPRHTPSNARRERRRLDTQEMYDAWQKEYRKLKKKSLHMSDVWYSRQIAKLPVAAGKDSETIRKHMKK